MFWIIGLWTVLIYKVLLEDRCRNIKISLPSAPGGPTSPSQTWMGRWRWATLGMETEFPNPWPSPHHQIMLFPSIPFIHIPIQIVHSILKRADTALQKDVGQHNLLRSLQPVIPTGWGILWALFSSRRHTEIFSPLKEISSGAVAVISETLMQKSHGWAIGRRFVFDLGSVWACPVFMSLQSDSSPAKPTGRNPNSTDIKLPLSKGWSFGSISFPKCFLFLICWWELASSSFSFNVDNSGIHKHISSCRQCPANKLCSTTTAYFGTSAVPLHTAFSTCQNAFPWAVPFCLCFLPCFDMAAFICLFYGSWDPTVSASVMSPSTHPNKIK